MSKTNRQTIIWIGALVVGALVGYANIEILNNVTWFVASAYTRLFQLLAIPTIALTVISTMVSLGKESNGGKLFKHTISYTLLTTIIATVVGVAVFFIVAPDNLPDTTLRSAEGDVPKNLENISYADHLLNVIPNNILKPLLEGNVLSVLFLAFAIGIGLSKLPESTGRTAVVNLFTGLQDLLFLLIRALIWTMPVGIFAFAAQLMVEVSADVVVSSLGKYTLIIIVGNLLQMFVVLPLLLISHKINPIKAITAMSPALLTAFFTKSSAATLPLTIETAEQRAGVAQKISRFVLPICTTINMNGCATFIAVTSLFVMQNSGIDITLAQVAGLVLVSVISAIGNAGVPMGCYFLTLSLVSGIDGAAGVMGVILPIYTIIDMVETSENVWSDSCVAMLTNKKLKDI